MFSPIFSPWASSVTGLPEGTIFVADLRTYEVHFRLEVRIVLAALCAAYFLGHGFAKLSNSTVRILVTISFRCRPAKAWALAA